MLNILAEGQYILPMCTIFGLEEDERGWLVQNQAKLKLENKLTDKDDDHEGIEVATSAFKVALSSFVWFVVVGLICIPTQINQISSYVFIDF